MKIKCQSYQDVKEAVRKSLDGSGIQAGHKVLLKPNLCNPVKKAVTHPEFIRAVIEVVKETTEQVYLSDLPAVNEQNITEKVLQETGVMQVLKDTKTKYSNIEKSGFLVRGIRDYRVLEKTDFAKIFFYADVVINLPKLKTHGQMYITGAVKNLMGLIHMDERGYLHKSFDREGFADGLIDIYNFMKNKTRINIMDAVEAMEGKGPVDGEIVNLGYVLSSDDAIALDYEAAKLTGHNPDLIPVLERAKKRNLLSGEDSSARDFKKHPNYGRENDLLPVINSNCTKCGACASFCPAKAIIEKENQYVIDENKCIKCYCCIENCKYRAIE